MLANIYLHYVLDIWFEKRFARSCRGRAKLIRYADDFVACFTHEEDAKRFSAALIERLAEFALEVEPSKTALLRFGSYAKRQCAKLGLSRPPSFDFLGFTHYVTWSRSKRFMVGRKTQGSRINKKLKEVGVRLAKLRTSGGHAMMDYTKRHLQGHIAYFGVSGNSRSLKTYIYRVSRVLFKWLNRRSQCKSVIGRALVRCSKHGYRRYVSSTTYILTIVDDSSWEPDGVTLQVRFCEGGKCEACRYSPIKNCCSCAE